ncbi:hypothetical protein CJP74_02570 [Psittacicella melopsittaci]|uniref:AAA+ ATPase domain-containing protein n=1 Tax=Psittacicella melopsittaci TaxID=2028576 RepID=A0A3A1Y7G4_9GAMM|nr:AAA family ATPase [Psittacicella melopsittaci]RIY33158.1 hypothetical protein CJP74_02570 [Psittacicella melopsittaci]
MKNYYLYEDLEEKDKLKLIKYFFSDVQPNANVIVPQPHLKDIKLITKYLSRPTGIHRVLLMGEPGGGKSALVKLIAAQTEKRLVKVDVTALISFDSFFFNDDRQVASNNDSELKIGLNGSLTKAIKLLFKLMREPYFANTIVFFDDMDYLFAEKTNNKYALLALTEGINNLPDTVGFIATVSTNIEAQQREQLFDELAIKSLLYTFQYNLRIIGQFTGESLLDYAYKVATKLGQKDIYAKAIIDRDLLYKILQLKVSSYYPAKIQQLLLTAFALSDFDSNPYDYLGHLYQILYGTKLTLHIEDRDAFEFRTYDDLYDNNAPQANLTREEIAKILGVPN